MGVIGNAAGNLGFLAGVMYLAIRCGMILEDRLTAMEGKPGRKPIRSRATKTRRTGRCWSYAKLEWCRLDGIGWFPWPPAPLGWFSARRWLHDLGAVLGDQGGQEHRRVSDAFGIGDSVHFIANLWLEPDGAGFSEGSSWRRWEPRALTFLPCSEKLHERFLALSAGIFP
jgi:hypothetical protein